MAAKDHQPTKKLERQIAEENAQAAQAAKERKHGQRPITAPKRAGKIKRFPERLTYEPTIEDFIAGRTFEPTTRTTEPTPVPEPTIDPMTDRRTQRSFTPKFQPDEADYGEPFLRSTDPHYGLDQFRDWDYVLRVMGGLHDGRMRTAEEVKQGHPVHSDSGLTIADNPREEEE